MAFYNSVNDLSSFVISFTQTPKQDFGIFAKGYTRAASTLAEYLLEKPRFADYEAYPVVFLYRHAFELYLKGLCYKAVLISYFKDIEIVDFKLNHRLEPLAKTFQKICEVHFPSDQDLLQFADKVYMYAVDFEQIDKNSFSYRYPTTKKGDLVTERNQIVSLQAFHNSMKELLDELDTVNFGFDVEESQAQEIYEIIQEAEILVASESSEA